jgi:hypothetical protein
MTVMRRKRLWRHRPQIALDRLGEERELVPVTLPKLAWLNGTVQHQDIEDGATRFAEYRTIRAGRDAWEEINRAESFESWKAIGKALAVGREHALKATGANAPMGRRYSLAFSEWAKRHGFAGMQKSVRSVALELYANIEAITAWRDGLPERQRKRLVHPLSNVRRWRASLNRNAKCRSDLKRDAMAAWRRFVSCVRTLPPDQAITLWQAVSAEAAAPLVANQNNANACEGLRHIMKASAQAAGSF